MGYVGQVTTSSTTHKVGSTLYGTCATAAATAAKVVALSDFDMLVTGVTVHVKFTYSNTASSATLKVGSTDAKPLVMYGTTRVGTDEATSWPAGSIVSFTYDGTSWVMNGYKEGGSGGDTYRIQSNSAVRVTFAQKTTTTSNTAMAVSDSFTYDPASIGCFSVQEDNVNVANGYVYKITVVLQCQGTSSHTNVAAEVHTDDYSGEVSRVGGIWSPVKTTTCYGQLVLETVYSPASSFSGDIYVYARSTAAGAIVGSNDGAYMIIECLGPANPNLAYANGVSF